MAVNVTIAIAIISIIIGILAGWIIGSGISKPIQRITNAMKTLSEGDMTTGIPSQDHKDKVGVMAAAVQVFNENMIKTDEMAKREAEDGKTRDERTKRVEKLTRNFNASVSKLLGLVAIASKEMESMATPMSSIVDDTNQREATVAKAAKQASANAQTVATATEEISSSIQEISRQVSQSS
jgi:methyl-accepting chemotaxis protein